MSRTQAGQGWAASEAAVESRSSTRTGGDALRYGVPAALLALASVGWWWSARMAGDMHGSGGAMSGMGSMDSHDVLSFEAFLVAWTAVMTAVMFPAISPVVGPYGKAKATGRAAPLRA